MNLLSVENISKTYGIKELFSGISFGINKGEKVGLIAKNGTGKTTLLRTLAGEETADEGNIVFRNGIKVGFLSQSENFDNSLTIKEVVFASDSPAIEAINRYNECIDKGIEGTEMENAFEAMNLNNAWDLELRIGQLLSELKVGDLSIKISTLSGGQKKRLALAKVLAYEPDFMILDEPTNHLDLDMIEWLEKLLEKSNSSLLMVTHDRYFLETVCNTILELDGGELYKYTGNYSYYLQKRDERITLEQTNITKAKNLFRTELEWMRKMPKARGTKSKARQDSFHDLKKVAKKKIAQDELSLNVKIERLGTKIIELHKVSKSYDHKILLKDLTYHFQRGEKLGIVGKNGTGKSTFLNLITENATPDKGKVVIGETVKFGYYRQDGIQLKDDKRVIEVVKDIAEIIPIEGGKKLLASQFLERFLFPTAMHYQYVSTLSGGEKRRLYLLTVLMENPNFLILDEPTNDLDIFTMNVLEEYLFNFQGCAVVVSHDRYFMDKITDHLFVFKGEGEIQDILGNYTAWREKEKQQKYQQSSPVEEKETPVEPIAKQEKSKTKLTYKEKLEFEGLELDLELLEKSKTELTEKLSTGTLSSAEVMEVSNELSALVEKLEEKTDRWLYLADFA